LQEGRDGIPLHDALVGECDPPAPFQLAVRCRKSGRNLALTANCKDEYTSWMHLLAAMAREWSDKRRASMLNKQLMALGNKTKNDKNAIFLSTCASAIKMIDSMRLIISTTNLLFLNLALKMRIYDPRP